MPTWIDSMHRNATPVQLPGSFQAIVVPIFFIEYFWFQFVIHLIAFQMLARSTLNSKLNTVIFIGKSHLFFLFSFVYISLFVFSMLLCRLFILFFPLCGIAIFALLFEMHTYIHAHKYTPHSQRKMDWNEMHWRFHSGVSGYDSQGHGHYFANYPNSHSSQEQPSLPNSPHQQAPPRPLNQPTGQHETSHHSSSQSQQYDADATYGAGHGNTNNDRNNSGKGSYSGNWNYIKNELLNSNDRNSGQHSGQHGYSQTQDKDAHQR